MITGVVNADREAVIRLKVVGPSGQEEVFEAVIDTGFTGFLTLPAAKIAALGLPYANRQQVLLADGNLHFVNVHTGEVDWDGQLRRIEVDSADTTPLVGMGLMYGYKLTIEDVDGGAVTIALLVRP